VSGQNVMVLSGQKELYQRSGYDEYHRQQ